MIQGRFTTRTLLKITSHNSINYQKIIINPSLSFIYNHAKHLYTFSNAKKQQSKKKSYNLQGIEESKLPEHLKKSYIARKQINQMQVPSQAQLQNKHIIGQITKQRQQIMKMQQQQHDTLTTNKNFIQTFLLGVTGTNIALFAFLTAPILTNHAYWLGVYSSTIMYPSLIAVSCASIGINMAYLILRQSLAMHTSIQQLQPKSFDITKSPISYWLQISLIGLQILSMTAIANPNISLMKLPSELQQSCLYTAIFILLSVNFHYSYQCRDFPQNANNISKANKYKWSVHYICFVILYLIGAYVQIQFVMKQGKNQNQQKQLLKFDQGREKVNKMWKTKKFVLQKDQKITDIIENDQDVRKRLNKQQQNNKIIHNLEDNDQKGNKNQAKSSKIW